MRGAPGFPMAFIFSVLLLGVADVVRCQFLATDVPDHYEPREYAPLFKGVNQCAYLRVLLPDGSTDLAWTCGLTDKKKKVEYDCCPGYRRTSLVNNECVEKTPTYKTIAKTLLNKNMTETANLFQTALTSIDKEDGVDFTVFIPYNDKDTKKVPTTDINSLIVNGRHYSSEFRDGTTIHAKNGYPLKISTYQNGLVFVECQLLMKPDFETTNGLIHVTASPIKAADRYVSVLKQLQKENDLSAFVADISPDLRRELDSTTSTKRYTVFAPSNTAWQNAKRRFNDPQDLDALVRQHILEGLHCGLSLDEEARLLGPTKSMTYIHGVQQSDGSRILIDMCGNKVKIDKMDTMASNGVFHKLNNVLGSVAAMNFDDTLKCLASGPDAAFSQAAQKMSQCKVNVQKTEEIVILLPTSDALRDASKILSNNPCRVFQEHILVSQECKMKNGHGIGVPQECLFTTKYTPPGGTEHRIANQYIPTREGSRLHFGKAVTSNLKPISFKGGVIYQVESLNTPPTQTMMQVVRGDPELSTTLSKMQQVNFENTLKGLSPNVVFLAPQNRGWRTRRAEDALGSDRLLKLLKMHTIQHQLITGENGNIDSETIQTLPSISGTPISIKRNLDGTTFIGYTGLPSSEWSVVVGEPITAVDGIVWVVDWPLVCQNC